MSDKVTKNGSEASDSKVFDVFISHASSDTEIARVLADRLSSQGVRVWLGENELRLAGSCQDQIRNAIQHSRVGLVLTSGEAALSLEPSVSVEWSAIQESSWRRKEFLICPLRLDDADMPPFLRTWQSLHLDKHTKDATEVDRTVKGVERLLEPVPPLQKSHPTESEELARAERFAELERALQSRSESPDNQVDGHD